MPSGADCSPLDIFVNPELKRRLRGRDLSTQTKIMESCARALADMSADPAFKESLKKCCKGIKKRCKWVQAFGGRICTSSLVAAWDSRGGEKKTSSEQARRRAAGDSNSKENDAAVGETHADA